MRKAVAIDFDNTLCTSEFPKIIEPIHEAISFVKECQQAGVAVILWTCRTGHHLEEALSWCKKQGIQFDAVNNNLDDWVGEFYTAFPSVPPDCRKVAVNLYIDDLALGGVEWDKAFDWLRRYGYQ